MPTPDDMNNRDEDKVTEIITAQSILEKVRAKKKDENLSNGIEPITTNNPKVEVVLTGNDPQIIISNIDTQIAKLRANDFDFTMQYTDDEGLKRTLYIKDHTHPDAKVEKDPVHPDTAEIQALQYLKGVLLIASHVDERISAEMLDAINKAYAKYSENAEKAKDDVAAQAQATVDLTNEFAKIISERLGVKINKAHKQVTMARDIGISLTLPPAVCTISSQTNVETITKTVTDENGKTTKVPTEVKTTTEVAELATPIKIGQPDKTESETYYQRHFTNIDNQPWFQSAAQAAGLDASNSWMTSLFRDRFTQLAECGVAAPPSARWLPTPSGSQLIDTYVEKTDAAKKVIEAIDHQFVRTGITSAFEIASVKEQEKLAKEQINELVRIMIDLAIAKYEKRYGSYLAESSQKPRKFFISYQTLLSPFIGEELAYAIHRDNNGMFVKMAKEAIEKVAQEHKDKLYPSKSSNNSYTLQFEHTNSSINKLADKFPKLIRKFKEDKDARKRKFEALADTIHSVITTKPHLGQTSLAPNLRPQTVSSLGEVAEYIRTGEGNLTETRFHDLVDSLANCYAKTPEGAKSEEAKLTTELATRARAAYYLRKCLNKEHPYDKLPRYQRNLIASGLEALVLGSQGLHLKGCKSARDRTAVAAAALRTMLADHKKMNDPDELMKGVMKALEEGHHFRAMLYHNPIVKIGDVHKELKRLLLKPLQDKIDALLVFGKKFKQKKEGKPKLKDRLKTLVELGAVHGKTFGKKMLDDPMIGGSIKKFARATLFFSKKSMEGSSKILEKIKRFKP